MLIITFPPLHSKPMNKNQLGTVSKCHVFGKPSRFGYDGFGVKKKIETQSDWASVPNVPCIVEDCVAIAKKLLSLLREKKQERCVSYPPVEMEFHPQANQVEYVFTPQL